MIIAIASGKGGTGKTSLSVNLAALLAPVQLLDCDVEEPNAHLFLKADVETEDVVSMAVPEIIPERCNTCSKCVHFCQYNALALAGGKPMVFADMCHGCGGCTLVCRRGAIRERPQRIGVVTTRNTAKGIQLHSGCLDVGHSLASAVVDAVKERLQPGEVAILDAPPGTTCPVVATLRGVDFVVLVTEPTPFGLNDLKLAVAMVRALGLPFGVVVNRAGSGDARVQTYCAQEGIALLLEIPHDRRIAEAHSNGQLIIEALPEYRPHFERLWQAIRQQAVALREAA